MKEKFRLLCRWFSEAFTRTLQRYPVELLLIVCGCIGCMVYYNLTECEVYTKLESRLALVPLFIVLALTINLLAGATVWRRVYWVCWMPLIPLLFWSELQGWIESVTYRISLGLLAPLALLMACRARENSRFVGDAVVWFRSWVLALLFPNVALGLFCAILYSTAYIFGIEGVWVGDTAMHTLILCETLCVPVLMLMLADRGLGVALRGSKIMDILLNYIITPALLIYCVILYLYIIKIVVTWSLPIGGVAYMVFGFTIFAMIVKALQEVLDRRIYGWFFNRFSLYALPAVVLFWVGVMERIGEYGLTEGRVWLVVCGSLMTLCIGIFLSLRLGRYLYVAMVAFAVFALLAYVPAWNPERIAIRSQTVRAERIARGLGILDADGKISLSAVAEADTADWREYKKLDDALSYLQFAVDRKDTLLVLQRYFGITYGAITDTLPSEVRHAMKEYPTECGANKTKDDDYFYVLASESPRISLEKYRYLIADPQGYTLENDTLRIRFGDARPDFCIAGRDLLDAQLRKINVGPDYNEDVLQEKSGEFLLYTEQDMAIYFRNLIFVKDSVPALHDVGIRAILLK